MTKEELRIHRELQYLREAAKGHIKRWKQNRRGKRYLDYRHRKMLKSK